MQRSSLRLLALSAFVLCASFLLAQTKSGTATPAPAPQQQKLVKVAILNTVEANREFQANVQLLQGQRQAAVEMNAAMEKEKDAKKKQELKTQLDQVMAKLNENNDKMQKAYGFSLTRNYSMEIEKANIYMFVTDEEAAAIEKAQQAEAKKAADTKKAETKKKK
jgi:IS30 family transposase